MLSIRAQKYFSFVIINSCVGECAKFRCYRACNYSSIKVKPLDVVDNYEDLKLGTLVGQFDVVGKDKELNKGVLVDDGERLKLGALVARC